MGGLFSSPPPPPIPPPKPPAPMPDPESPEVLEAKRKATLNALARDGRESTILSTPTTRIGSTTDYSRNKLGGR